MAELADALDLGSSSREWGFKSLCPHQNGGIAQLVEHLPYKQAVIGSSPIVPTKNHNSFVVFF